MYLEKINGPADVKALNSPERTVLATEMAHRADSKTQPPRRPLRS